MRIERSSLVGFSCGLLASTSSAFSPSFSPTRRSWALFGVQSPRLRLGGGGGEDDKKDKDPDDKSWLSWMQGGRRGRGVGEIRLREAAELGGVARSDRYSSRYVSNAPPSALLLGRVSSKHPFMLTFRQTGTGFTTQYPSQIQRFFAMFDSPAYQWHLGRYSYLWFTGPYSNTNRIGPESCAYRQRRIHLWLAHSVCSWSFVPILPTSDSLYVHQSINTISKPAAHIIRAATSPFLVSPIFIRYTGGTKNMGINRQ